MKQKLKKLHKNIIEPIAFAVFVVVTVIFVFWTFTQVADSAWGILGMGIWWVSLIWILARGEGKSE